jgi:hypothetical protein
MIQTNAKWWVERLGSSLKPNEFNEAKRVLTEDAYRAMFNTADGEIVLHELFEFCGMDKVTYSNDFKPTTLAFYEGQKSVLLHMLQMLEYTQFMMMKKQGAKQ